MSAYVAKKLVGKLLFFFFLVGQGKSTHCVSHLCVCVLYLNLQYQGFFVHDYLFCYYYQLTFRCEACELGLISDPLKN